MHDAKDENKRIERAEDQQHAHHQLGAVGSRELPKQLIERVERHHEKRQQGMADGIVAHVPVGNHGVGVRVEARHVEIVHKHLPLLVGIVGKETEEFGNHQILKHSDDYQGHHGHSSLFATDMEKTKVQCQSSMFKVQSSMFKDLEGRCCINEETDS